jgi:GT2 family glycosyltransferase
MLSFLRTRARTQSSPRFRAPLRDATWIDRVLTLRVDGAVDSIAIDIDGFFFADVPVVDGGATLAFDFAPGGRSPIACVPRLGRGGDALVNEALVVRFGADGFGDASDVIASSNEVAQSSGDAPSVPLDFDRTAIDIAIVVPIHNAASLVERCIESVLAHTTGRARLILIDDASTEAAIAPLLARHASIANVVVLRNETNRGFTATANRGIEAAGRADVVLLNADTEVGPNWLTGLICAAYSASNVATATAVSNNAGAFSVPELERDNPPAAAWSFDDTARALWQRARCAYPELPTGNGFCLYIRRAVIDAVGVLDEAAFPQGYGEENDFCQRASARGLRHVIAGNVYVKHARSASFGDERRATLGAAGMAVLRERWPNYERDVGRTLFSFERRVLDWRVRRIFASASSSTKPAPRVLYSDSQDDRPRDAWRLDVRGNDVDLWHDGNVIVSHADATSLDAHLRDWLQAYAIEAVVVDERALPELRAAASALGVPLIEAKRGEDGDAAYLRAVAASRSFARMHA